MDTGTTGQTRKERVKVKGEEMLAKVRELFHEGNVRRITVTDASDRTILEIPLTAGVIGAIIAPALVAIGAIAALAKNYTLEVEKVEPAEPKPSSEAEIEELVTSG